MYVKVDHYESSVHRLRSLFCKNRLARMDRRKGEFVVVFIPIHLCYLSKEKFLLTIRWLC